MADARQAYDVSVANGAVGVLAPLELNDAASGRGQLVSEVALYGDVVLRYVSGDFEVTAAARPGRHAVGVAEGLRGCGGVRRTDRCHRHASRRHTPPPRAPQGPYLAGCVATPDQPTIDYGLQRLDHSVGNVPELVPVLEHIMGFTGLRMRARDEREPGGRGAGGVPAPRGQAGKGETAGEGGLGTLSASLPPACARSFPRAGLHEFAEFVAEDVGTVDSGLNSMVLGSNNEMVLLPINEPTFGTRRKSQIQAGGTLCEERRAGTGGGPSQADGSPPPAPMSAPPG